MRRSFLEAILINWGVRCNAAKGRGGAGIRCYFTALLRLRARVAGLDDTRGSA
jgi:hypothetical protein